MASATRLRLEVCDDLLTPDLVDAGLKRAWWVESRGIAA
jgi:hypothetical protein